MKSTMFKKCCLLVLGLVLLTPAWASRLALVIGNDAYSEVEPLKNARNDARLMASVLRKAGFEVTTADNLNRTNLWRTLDIFKGRIQKGDEVVFYFAGHGVQIGANQLLLPTDIAAQNDGQVQRDGVPLVDVQDALKDARLSVLLIDACRDNPFPKTGTRSIGGTRGLAPAEPSTGQIIMMSAGRNQKALDRVPDSKQANGLFTWELSQVLQTPGIEIRAALEDVKNRVDDKARRVGHEQRPSLVNDLRGNFYLLGGAVTQVASVRAEPAVVLPAQQPPPVVASLPTTVATTGTTADRSFPSKPVSIVVPFPAGGTTDIAARALASQLASQWNVPVVVDNAPGAGGAIGASKVVRSPPDGYTLLLHNQALAYTSVLQSNLSFNPAEDLEPLGMVYESPMVWVGRPNLPVHSAADFGRWLRADGAKATYASSGMGTSSQLCGIQLSNASQASFTHVPYRGTAPALVDLAGGQVDLMCMDAAAVEHLAAGGKIKVLALASVMRPTSGVLQSAPTMAAAGISANAATSSWAGLYAPKGVPAGIVERINGSIQSVLQSAEFRDKLSAMGLVATAEARKGQSAHRQIFATEVASAGAAFRAAGLTPQ